jgi:hypothetical protein
MFHIYLLHLTCGGIAATGRAKRSVQGHGVDHSRHLPPKLEKEGRGCVDDPVGSGEGRDGLNLLHGALAGLVDAHGGPSAKERAVVGRRKQRQVTLRFYERHAPDVALEMG